MTAATGELDEAALDATFSALASPVRRAMLTRLAQGEAGVNELAGPFGLSLPAISRHVRVLERAGLVTQSRRAQSRPCRLRPDELNRVADWARMQTRLWDARLDQLGDYVQSLTQPEEHP